MQIPDIKDTLFKTLSQYLAQRSTPPVPRLIPPARKQGTVVSFDGTPIYWEMHGPAPSDPAAQRPIVLCYGLVCAMNQWRYQLERYSKDHPCLLIDYRGHHRSGTPKDPRMINISAMARDVAAAIHEQRFSQPAHIWGHSMGVNVALELVVSEPALCQSLVLLCGTMGNPFHAMFNSDVLEKFTDPLFKSYSGHEELFHLIWRLSFMNPKLARVVAGIAGFNDKASTPADLDAYVAAIANMNPATFFPLIEEFSRGLTGAIVPKVNCPSVVVAGALDYVTPPVHQRQLAQALKGSEYVEIPTGSHNVQLDFGEYVCMKVEAFWRERKLD